MASATVRCADSTGKKKGRPGKSSPFQIIHIRKPDNNDLDWRTQLLMGRIGLSAERARLVSSMIWEAAHA
jgi:hypothetical protein